MRIHQCYLKGCSVVLFSGLSAFITRLKPDNILVFQVRTIIRNSFKEALDKNDILISPAAPSAAYKIGTTPATFHSLSVMFPHMMPPFCTPLTFFFFFKFGQLEDIRNVIGNMSR